MIIPFVKLLVVIPELVLWIVYWKQIAGFSRTLDLYPLPQPLPRTVAPASHQI